MADVRYFTAFAHLLSTGASALGVKYFMNNSSYQPRWIYGTLGVFLLNSATGVIRYGTSHGGSKILNFYINTQYLSLSLGYALFTGELYHFYGYEEYYIYLHIAGGLIPMICYMFASHDTHLKSLELITGINILSSFAISYLEENYFGFGAGVCYFINYFIIGTTSYVLDEVPAIDLFHYGLCFLHYFMYKTLSY